MKRAASGLSEAWPLWAAVVAASVLRGDQLLGQILFGDEWHAIHKAERSDWWQIWSSFGAADHGIPISLFYELASNTTGLAEWAIKLPHFAAGVATVALLPILLRPWLGRFETHVFAWLMALSPILVLLSRWARPYSLASLCAMGSLLAFFHWWRSPRLRTAFLYVGLTTATGMLLLVYLPFVLAPFIYAFGIAWRGNRADTRLVRRQIVALGGATLGALGIALTPPLLGDLPSLVSKVGGAPLQMERVATAVMSWAGMPGILLTILLVLLVLLGWLRGLREHRTLTLYLTLACACQIAAVFVVRPFGLLQPLIIARYLLPAGVVALLFVSIGLAGVFRGTPRARALSAPLLCVALFLAGPIPTLYYRPNDWISLQLTIGLNAADGLSRFADSLRRIPTFYAQLPPGSGKILEAPSYHGPGANHLPLYQRIHQREVVLGAWEGLCDRQRYGHPSGRTPGMSFRSHLPMTDPDALQARGVEYVVLHKHLFDETSLGPRRGRDIDMSACIDRYREWRGPPAFEDPDIVVFSLTPS